MKKFFLSALIAVVSFSCFAEGAKAKKLSTYKATQNLYAEFGIVENLKWTPAANNMLKAEFVKDEEAVTAFFDQNGDYYATTRNKTIEELPAKLRTAISKKLNGGSVTTLFEMDSKDETAYYVEIMQDGTKKVWKCTAFGEMSEYKAKI